MKYVLNKSHRTIGCEAHVDLSPSYKAVKTHKTINVINVHCDLHTDLITGFNLIKYVIVNVIQYGPWGFK